MYFVKRSLTFSIAVPTITATVLVLCQGGAVASLRPDDYRLSRVFVANYVNATAYCTLPVPLQARSDAVSHGS